MLVTENGGATWENLLLPSTRNGNALDAVADGFIVGGGASTILRVTREETAAIPPEPAPAAPGFALGARATADGAIAATFTLAAGGKVDLAIVDVTGRRVATLARGEFPAHAPITRTWNGRTASHRSAASGVYFVRLVSGREARAVKVVIAR